MFSLLLTRCPTAAAQFSKQTGALRHFSKEIDFAKMVAQSPVVVFMKGMPDSPRCGYSHKVCSILKMHGVEFQAHDVLVSREMREGIKKFSDWPTIPQVFINGEFIGGCDILDEMHFNGELVKLLESIGVKSLIRDKYENLK